ncbi:MAG: AAA family ATPase [Fimbriiglobus sp.]
MKLIRMSFHDHDAKWGFKNLVFDPHVTLVVGATGVGKTRLLEAIEYPKQILRSAIQKSNVKFDIDFCHEGKTYRWVFSSLQKSASGPSFLGHGITEEDFFVNGKVVCTRRGSDIFINQVKEPFVLSSGFSAAIGLEEAFIPIETFCGIFNPNEVHEVLDLKSLNLFLSPENSDLNNCRFDLKTPMLSGIQKLILTHHFNFSAFKEIEEIYCSIFPSISKISVPDEKEPTFQFTDSKTGVDFGIERLSNGMRKTLEMLLRIKLNHEDIMLLIDEIEAGLGANCLNAIVGEIQDDRNKQYIITSHHHYVLNHFPLASLRVMAREGVEARFYNSDDLKLGKSRHEAYTLLLNNDTFLEGKFRDEPVLSG